jgi:hypothetical protein
MNQPAITGRPPMIDFLSACGGSRCIRISLLWENGNQAAAEYKRIQAEGPVSNDCRAALTDCVDMVFARLFYAAIYYSH